jgi:hypothetical protein
MGGPEIDAFTSSYKACDEAIESGSEGEALTAAREALKLAVVALLAHVSNKVSDTALCQEVDDLMCTYRPEAGKYDNKVKSSGPLLKPAVLKGSLLAALKSCSSYQALLAMPMLMETTRKLLCAAPANGVEKFLVEELGADIAKGDADEPTLSAIVDVLGKHMQAEGRLKKDLMGAQLGAPATKSVRTAKNKASKALEAVSAAAAGAAEAAAKKDAAAAAKAKADAFAELQKAS